MDGCVCLCVCVCVCVCARAHARACVYVCITKCSSHHLYIIYHSEKQKEHTFRIILHLNGRCNYPFYLHLTPSYPHKKTSMRRWSRFACYASFVVHKVQLNCRFVDSCMVCTYHTLRQPFQIHPARHLGEWAMFWSVEKMLDVRHQRVDIPAHTRTAHNSLLQKKIVDC